MELKDYSIVLRRRWRTIGACVVIVLAIAAALTWSATPLYSSTARLFISTSSSSNSGAAYTGELFASMRAASYADLIQSTELRERVAPSLAEAGVESSGSVTANVVPETVILEITATATDPEQARVVAQAYAEGLSELVVDLEPPSGNRDALIEATIVDDAQASTSPVSPQPVRNLALGAILGLLLGLGVAVLRHRLDTRIVSSEAIGEITSAPILGNIFHDAVSAKDEPAAALAGTSPWAEAFRVLRTNMQYVEVDTDKLVFAVTSSLPEEGKSTVATNLALALALAKQRVVLVECDLRRPQLARRLGLDDSTGTTTILIGKAGMEDALQLYSSTGLHVLVCGHVPPNPSELLQSVAMEKLLGELRDRFDVVILDAPPLLPVTDAAPLAAEADGALVVVRHGETTTDQLTHSLERLAAVDAKTLGVVINQVPPKKSGAGYGYGYGYGYESNDTPGSVGSAQTQPVGRRRGPRKPRS